ncbi:hypothetical protein B0H16DRAFT_1588690 [Mycena metata]|uniref:Secreted protein n=1 Tax=Mycena metata TaxID=1033252 RepID=A0AAD7MQT6_9AGAR|nr:hypothetical protein B0H16DRAFT_1588690 [Mycena metata]
MIVATMLVLFKCADGGSPRLPWYLWVQVREDQAFLCLSKLDSDLTIPRLCPSICQCGPQSGTTKEPRKLANAMSGRDHVQ